MAKDATPRSSGLESESPPRSVPPDEAPLETAKVLLVDDRPENLLALEAVLERPDYELISVTSGEDCLRELLHHDVAVILMDVSMPGMDGFETARAIRMRRKTRRIPIVFVTAMMGQVEHVFHGYDVGAVDYLIKPVDEHALRAKVSVFVDLWRARRQIEKTSEELRRVEARQRALLASLYDVTFEEAPIGIGHAALNGHWLRVNTRLARILGREPDAVAAMSLQDVVYPADRPALLHAIQAIVEGREQRHKAEYRLLDKDGRIIWTALTFSLIRDIDGIPVQLTIVEDISEEKRLETALDASEQRFARLRDIGLIGVFHQRIDGTIDEANDAFLAMTGYSGEDLAAGRVHATALTTNESADVEADAAEQLVRTGVTVPYERRFRRKDGSLAYMLVGTVTADGVIGFALDVTKSREADHARARAVRELADSIRARDDFLALVAHELRTPLTPLLVQVTSMRTVARTMRTAAEPAWLDRQLGVIDRSALRLGALVEQLVEVSRKTVGRFPIEREETDLRDIVRAVVERESPIRARARCEIRLNATAPVRGEWDPHRIEQVVECLLSNACKFGSERPVDIGVDANEKEARIVVTDHGVGIAAEDMPHLFERFARRADVGHHGGFGLGLWLSRRVVEAHDGRIDVSSKLGEGSTFTVTLPLRPHGRDVRTAVQPELSASQQTVLIVDSNVGSREGLARSLRSAGYAVHAADMESALDSVVRVEPAVVLLDVGMQTMAGRMLLERLRAEPRTRDIPVLLVSPWPHQAATIAGAQGVLGKPLDVPLLLDRIREVVAPAVTA